MLQYPNIDPVIFSLTDTLQVRWYGVLYLFGLAGTWLLTHWRCQDFGWHDKAKLGDLFFSLFWGVIIGGRVGYMLFYAPIEWLHDPLLIFKTWHGGMSFHGGLIGVVVAMWWYARCEKIPFMLIGDTIAPGIPVGLGLGRLGNFINGELWGRATEMPWGMVFPHAGSMPRHPSQLYAILLEGVLLLCILQFYSQKPRQLGQISGLFLLAYGMIRIFEEFFRQPDPQYGYIAWGWLTMGQILCIPMVLLGAWLMKRRACKTT